MNQLSMRILMKNHGLPLFILFAGPSFSKTAVCLAFIFLLSAPGCRLVEWDSNSLHSTIATHEISHKAIYHNNKGLKYLSQGKTGKAETHFLKALDYDPAFAAAHNNLGNMYLSRRDLYQAAWEFQRASELEPNSIEPLINLGLLHDEADRLEEAEEFYLQALQVDPRSAIALGNLARVRVKQESDPIEIQSMLRDLVLMDTRPEWVDWAQELLATRYRSDYGAGLSNPVFNPGTPNGQSSPVNPAYPMGSYGSNPVNSNPLRPEEVAPSYPQTSNGPTFEQIPTPVLIAPQPMPTLMDIPNYQNGYSPSPIEAAPPIQFPNFPSETYRTPDRQMLNGRQP